MRESKVSTAPNRAHFLLYVARVPAGFLLEQIIKLVSYPKQNNSFGQSRVKLLVKLTNQNLNQTCAPGSKRWKCLKQLTIGQWFCVCVCVFFYDFVFLLLIGWENDAGFLNQSQSVAMRIQSYYEIITKINNLGKIVAKNGKNRIWLRKKASLGEGK